METRYNLGRVSLVRLEFLPKIKLSPLGGFITSDACFYAVFLVLIFRIQSEKKHF